MGIAGHAPVSARGEGDVADARAIWNTVSLELLGKEAADEHLIPLLNRGVIIVPVKGVFRGADDLFLACAAAEHMVEEEIVQLVGADDVLRYLRNRAVLGR